MRRPSGGLWRIAARRAAADWPLLAALFFVVVLATTVLAVSPIYGQAAAQAGVRRTLADAPAEQSTVELAARLTAAEHAAVDRAASAGLARLGAEVWRSGRSRSFVLPGGGAEDVPDLTVFAFFDDLARHAVLLDGRWPRAAARGVVEGALSEPAAAQLGLRVGDHVTVVSAERDALAVELEVVAVYAVADRAGAIWAGDPLELDGVERGDRTTSGPIVLERQTFLDELGGSPVTARWRGAPDFVTVTTDEVAGLRRDSARLAEGVNAALSGAVSVSARTGLVELLADVERALLVSGPGVLVPAVQIAALAAYALLACTRALAEQREPATALLRSRGADTRRLLVLALIEALALAAPAVVAGPLLAALSLRLLARLGPLADSGLLLEPRVSGTAFALSALAGLGCALVLAAPAWRGATDLAARGQAGRERAGPLRRAGADLALLAVAVLGYWQLRRYRVPLVERLEGTLGVDPFLAVAPALGILAGAVVALRALTLGARVFQWAAVRASALAPALSAWQLARRPQRQGRAVLLLTLALAVGVFGLCSGATWLRSQQDQADHGTGADLRVRPDSAPARVTAVNLAAAHEALPGVRLSLPVVLAATRGTRESGPGRLIAVDAAQAGQVVRVRPDLADQPVATLFDRLVAGRPGLPSVPLPPGSEGLAFDVALDLPAGDGIGGDAELSASVLLIDGDGLLLRVRLGELPGDGSVRRLQATFARPGEPAAAAPALVAIELQLPAPSNLRTGGLQVSDLRAIGGPGGVAQRTELERVTGWQVSASGPIQPVEAAAATAAASDGGLDLRLTTGSWGEFTDGAVTFRATPGPVAVPGPLPAVVDAAFLSATNAAVGDVVTLGGENGEVEVAGVVEAFPTLPAEGGGAVVVDLASYGAVQLAARGVIAQPEQWWLRLEDEAEGGAVAAALRAPPYSSAEVIDRLAVGGALRGDPIASATIGTLTLAFLASGLLAAIGFAVAATLAGRDRTADLAVLRAVGLSPRQLAGWLWLENGLLAAFGMLTGTVLGLVVARLVLPLVSLSQQAGTVVPRVLLVVPWRGVVALQACVLAALVSVTLAQIAAAKRTEVAAGLRRGAAG